MMNNITQMMADIADNLKNTLRHKAGIFFLALIAFCVVVLSMMFSILSLNKTPIGVELALSNQKWEVRTVEPNGLAAQEGIKVGDIPIEINGQPAEYFLKDYTDVGIVFSHPIDKITVLSVDGQLRSVSLQDSPQSNQAISEVIASFIVSLIFWVIGFFVFFKKPYNMAAILLCFCSVTFGLILSGNAAAERNIPLAMELSIFATIVGPWLLLHFFTVLPEERIWVRKNPLVYLIYLPPLVTIILFLLIGVKHGQPLPEFRDFRMIEAGIGLVATVGMVAFNFLNASSPRTRQQLKILLVSCVAALIPFIIFSVIPEAVFGTVILPSRFGILFVSFIPIGMAYAILTQKLMDIDIVIRRGVIYGLITILLAAIMSAVIFLMMSVQKNIGTFEEILLALILGIIATALFGPAKKGIEYWVDKIFYKDRYDYRQTIQNLSISLNTLNDLNDISRLIVGTTIRSLNVAGACLFVKEQSVPFLVHASEGIYSDVDRQNRLYLMILRRNAKNEFPHPASGSDPDLAYFIPLVAGGQEIGFLCLSKKTSRQDYSATDIFLLQGLASVAAVALRNAVVVRDVSLQYTWVSIASHELRAPLTAIVGYADLLLKREKDEGKTKQWLTSIRDSGLILSRMADDLLNVSRIQSGRLSLKFENVDIPALVEQHLAFIRETTRIHQFMTEFEEGLPKALADHDKLGQIISNLLSNAVKYSPNGGQITVKVQYDRENKRNIISVADQGIGISPQDQITLFKTFHRIQRPETTRVRGSGLGLYIVKEWTEQMGGKVWLTSELNKGSTFFIAIPVSDSTK